MSDPITMDMEQLNAIIAAVQAATSSGGRKRKGSGPKRTAPTPEETELRRKANDEECARKFTAAGYKDVIPRTNVLTFKKWMEKGRQVRKGEKGTQVGPFNLFHESQTDPITATFTHAEVEKAVTAAAPASAATPTAPKAEVKAVEQPTPYNGAGARAAKELAADKAASDKLAKQDWTDWNA